MGERFAEQFEVAAIDDTARRPRHMRLAVHRREGGDIAESADRTARNLSAMRLAAVLENPDAAPMCLADDFVGLGGVAGGVHEEYRRDVRAEPFADLLDADM
jgi:hypothetical protein